MIQKTLKNTAKQLILLFCILLSTGCTTINGPPNPDDPLESYNRSMFKFNDTVDKYALKPVAKGYNFVMPNIASKGVTNFFRNIDDIVVFANELLQFKVHEAIETSARFVFNSSIGLLGLIDVSSEMNLPKHNEDFGQTLAVWGVNSGPYIVLPLLGSSTIRDTAGLVVDWTYFDPVSKRQTTRLSMLTLTLKTVDIRASLIKASDVIDQTAPDKYAFIRDAWLQRRQYLIYDGNPPDDVFSNDELFNDDDLK